MIFCRFIIIFLPCRPVYVNDWPAKMSPTVSEFIQVIRIPINMIREINMYHIHGKPDFFSDSYIICLTYIQGCIFFVLLPPGGGEYQLLFFGKKYDDLLRKTKILGGRGGKMGKKWIIFPANRGKIIILKKGGGEYRIFDKYTPLHIHILKGNKINRKR